MNQKILIPTSLFLALLLSGSAFTQTRNAFFYDNIQNREAVIRQNNITKELIYDYTFNKKGIKDSALASAITFDTRGNIIEELVYNDKKEITRKDVYQYHIQNLLSKKTSTMTGRFKLETIDEYDYDSTGNERTYYSYNSDTTSLTIEQKNYNEKNQVTELVIKINDNVPYVSRRYHYDEKGELLKAESLDQQGSWMYSTLYEYNSTGNKKSVYTENSDGKKLTQELFFNSIGQCMKKIRPAKQPMAYQDDNSISKLEFKILQSVDEYTYNADGTLFEWTVKVDNKIKQIRRHYYLKK